MSWLQWRDEVWPATDKEAELSLHLWAADAACPRQSWTWSLFHHVRPVSIGPEEEIERYVDMEISNLHCQTSDWRRFSGYEIRADAAWHEQHETTHEYGHLDLAQITITATTIRRSGTRPDWKIERRVEEGIAHDFILRFGERDGFCFPCELDAWVLPKEEYYRKKPETADELARFAEGPPNLRLMARTRFERASVLVPPDADPAPRARRYLREAINFQDDFRHAEVHWDGTRTPDGKEFISRPGSRSTVYFRTTFEPENEQRHR